MFDKLIWEKDRMILGDLVFRLEHVKDEQWELGDDCFAFYKLKGLIDQYETFWKTRPDFQAQNIFELGMWDGGSVAFWFELLRPKKHVAIDITQRKDSAYFERYIKERGLEKQVRTYWGTDQTNTEMLREIIKREFDGPLDLVFDDASHNYQYTKVSFETLFPLLRPGGLYIIEDWAWYHWAGMEKAFAGSVPLTRLIFELVEATGSSTEIIKALNIYQGFAAVERGEVARNEVDKFNLEKCIYRLKDATESITGNKALLNTCEPGSPSIKHKNLRDSHFPQEKNWTKMVKGFGNILLNRARRDRDR